MTKQDPNVTVIGTDALSLCLAAQMAHHDAGVVYVDARKGTAVQELDAPWIRVTGEADYSSRLTKITSSYSSVAESGIVVIAAPASYHPDVFEQVIPLIHSGQTFVLFPACFGAINLKRAALWKNCDITICEAVSFLNVCEMQGENTVFIQSEKSSMRMAVSPSERTRETLELLNRYFGILSHAENFLETSMDNINMVLHPLPLLLNIRYADTNISEFRHYVDGVTPTVGKLLEQLDEERLAIGNAFGLNLNSALFQLKEYYGDRNLPSLTEYVSSESGPYPLVKGYGLDSRYITEDVPFLLVAAASLGKACGIETPVMDLCIHLAALIHQTDYSAIGCTLEKMGLENRTPSEIRSYLEN